MATGGAGGPGFAVPDGTSGAASAQSSAQSGSGSVTTTAQSPAGGAASAMTTANIGAGPFFPIPAMAGQTVSTATLSPGSAFLAIGAMSAGYGGSGEQLTYEATADFTVPIGTPGRPGPLYLTLFDDFASGNGFDTLTLQIDIGLLCPSCGPDGSITTGSEVYTFTDLSNAESFFFNNKIDLGYAPGGVTRFVDLSYSLTASEPGAGFGFAYTLSTPEPSTWAMMTLGFAGLGYAAYRRGAKVKPALA
jgi:hypothetical protein